MPQKEVSTEFFKGALGKVYSKEGGIFSFSVTSLDIERSLVKDSPVSLSIKFLLSKASSFLLPLPLLFVDFPHNYLR